MGKAEVVKKIEMNRIRQFLLFRSIRARLTVLYVAIFGSTMVVFSFLLYSVFVRNNQAEFDTALFNHAIDVAHSVDIGFFGDVIVDSDLLDTGGKIFPFALGKAFVQILNSQARLIARSGGLQGARLPYFREDFETASFRGVAFRTIGSRQIENFRLEKMVKYRLLTYLVQDRGSMRFFLQIAVPLTLVEQEARGLLFFLFSAIPLCLVIATFAGFFLAGKALAPVGAMIDKVKGLDQTKLYERIPVPLIEDEMKWLSLTLNELLDRLQAAFESQDRFVAEASHELRTPLAILRGELDLIQQRHRSETELKEFFASASQELDHLSRMVEDLLLLARADAGKALLSFAKVRIDEILLDIVARLDRVALQSGVKIKVDLKTAKDSDDASGESVDFCAVADSELIRCMMKNLIENAVKYSTRDGIVEIVLTDKADTLLLEVRDHGPGISESDTQKIFDRFFRGQLAASQTKGLGLGLTIVKKVAQAHSAFLDVKSQIGMGSTFLVELPRCQNNQIKIF